MLELLAYLRANGFKTFIVSGGGIEFMRPWTEKVYGIPPEQVVGSSGKTKFEMRDGKPVLMRLPEVNFIDDKAGKPVGINAAHRPPAHRGLRQLRRRSADARMDHGRRAARASRCSCITTMPNANMPTTAKDRTSAASTRPGTKRSKKAGPSSA